MKLNESDDKNINVICIELNEYLMIDSVFHCPQ